MFTDFLVKVSLSGETPLFKFKNLNFLMELKRCINQNEIFFKIIGDCINKSEFNDNSIKPMDIPKLKGNFYYIYYNKFVNKLIVASSMWGILPLYYYEYKSCFYISNKIDLIKEELSCIDHKINKKFILNQFLFNYQFGNDTIYQGVKLLDSNTYIEISDGKINFKKYFNTEEIFVTNPTKWRQSIDSLSDLFIDNAAYYIPDESFISFTSGFDGRTLVSIATSLNRKFNTFSFGKINNDDVSIPYKNAKELHLPYLWLDLGSKEYIMNGYLKNAKAYSLLSNGGNGFLYPHILYSAKFLSNKTDCLISGIFGSEIFRAMHLTGAVTSKALVDLFVSNSKDAFLKKIRESSVLKVLNVSMFKTEIEELLEESNIYKKSLPSELSTNQKFYLFVFDEIFRKFFGTWVAVQQKYLTVRTPFLDFQFIQELFKTELAGAYNDFYTDNPLKRFKGQLLYSEIIRKTNKNIYKQKTGKGYSPRDVRNPIHRIKIIYPFLKKRIKRNIKSVNLDNLGIISGILNNKAFCEDILRKNEYLNNELLIEHLNNLTPFVNEQERDLLLMSLSMSFLLNKDNEKF